MLSLQELPIPETDWGHLQGAVNFSKRVVRQHTRRWEFRAFDRAYFADGGR